MRLFLTALVSVGLAAGFTRPAFAQQGMSRGGEVVIQPGAGQPAGKTQEPKDPGERYLNAYNLCQESEELANSKKYTQAFKKGQRAEKVLAGIVRDFPDWKPNMVATRRRILSENLERYKKLAAEAPIPSGRQPGQHIATDSNIPIPGIPETPSGRKPGLITPAPDGPSDYEPIELPDYDTTDKKLYNALARAQEECRRMTAAYKELNSRFVETRKQLASALIEQKVYKERYEELQKKIAEERRQGNKVVESLTRQLSEMEEKYRSSEKARKEAEARVTQLETTLAATQEELERVTRERDALRSENEQLRAIVELNSPEKTKALLDQNLSLADQLKSAQERVAMLEGLMAGTDDQNAVLQQQLENAREEAENLRQEMAGVYDENRGYRRRISELSERLNNLEADLEAAANRPVVDPALAEENKVLRDVIAKQRRTLEMQEEGRRLLVETYKQIKNQDPAMISAIKRLDDESSLDLTEAEQRLIDTIRKPEDADKPAKEGISEDAVRRSLQIETLANSAAKAFSKGRYTAAEQLYRTLYEAQPDHVAGLVNLGTILLYRNKCEEAVEFFERAARLAPDLAISYYLAGTSYYRIDRMEQAERMFTRTVELDPANAEAFFYLANIEATTDRVDIALKHFAAAVKLKSALGDAHYNMARLYAERDEIPDAARAYDRAVHAGSEPDPEFENFLRNHPNIAKAPGPDLVEMCKPEEEADALRAADPEIAKLVADTKDTAQEVPESGDGEPATTPDTPAEGVATTGDTPATETPVSDTPAEGTPAEGVASTGKTGATVAVNPAPVKKVIHVAAMPSTPEAREQFLKSRESISRPVRTVSTPSTAGTAHTTSKSRFTDVVVNAPDSDRKIKLRMKRPEVPQLRTRGEELKPAAPTKAKPKPKPKPKPKTTKKRKK